MFLDLAHLGAEFIDLFRHTFEVLYCSSSASRRLLISRCFVMKGFELFADHGRDFVADHRTRNVSHVIFRKHAIFDEVDGLKDILGVLIHRSPV